MHLAGLYAITDENSVQTDTLLQTVEQAIRGGTRLVQYRNKVSVNHMRTRQAGELLQLCAQYAVPMIINDDVQLAKRIGASGVHIGKSDMSLSHAREILGDQTIIGVSCYNRLDLAVEAESRGADYVAFGSFFTSMTKPHAVKADVNLVIQAKQVLHKPVCAIGGITHENANVLINAGVDMLAVIDGLFGQSDIQAAAERYAKLF